jgi:cyclophilin family peptidyl-prolyl cis-trans isomerase
MATYISEPATKGKIALKTTLGDVEVELWSKETPKACRNFVQLCMEGYFDNTIFHRIVKGFLIQGGDPTGTGFGTSSFSFSHTFFFFFLNFSLFICSHFFSFLFFSLKKAESPFMGNHSKRNCMGEFVLITEVSWPWPAVLITWNPTILNFSSL